MMVICRDCSVPLGELPAETEICPVCSGRHIVKLPGIPAHPSIDALLKSQLGAQRNPWRPKD